MVPIKVECREEAILQIFFVKVSHAVWDRLTGGREDTKLTSFFIGE